MPGEDRRFVLGHVEPLVRLLPGEPLQVPGASGRGRYPYVYGLC
jgi:hypothetical protein